jgi:hypothetical protein
MDQILAVRSREGSSMAFTLTLGADEVPVLEAALLKHGRPTHGRALEEVVVRIVESGDPPWASELEFDSEADVLVVRCHRKAPLQHLVRRLERRLASPAALRRLVRSVPEEG